MVVVINTVSTFLARLSARVLLDSRSAAMGCPVMMSTNVLTSQLPGVTNRTSAGTLLADTLALIEILSLLPRFWKVRSQIQVYEVKIYLEMEK